MKPHEALARQLYLALAGSSGSGIGRHIEDDGVSWSNKSGAFLDLSLALSWSSDTAKVTLTRRDGEWPIPEPDAWTTHCPRVEKWKVVIVHA